MDRSVKALVVYDGGLIAGGDFHVAGGTYADHIARWNGASWEPLGSDMDATVAALMADDVVNPGQLLAGGSFTMAGDEVSGFFARWGPVCPIGDIDQDGVVGVDDFEELMDAWGPCQGPCPPHCPADLDDDCQVGIVDFLLLLANWS